MVQQRAKARLLGKSQSGKAHDGGSESGPLNGIRLSATPKPPLTRVQSPGRWTEELDALLASNAVKPAREQLTLIRLFEELRGRGYDGGYDAVRRYARRWAKERGQAMAAAYVPLSFAPGEAFQFDWSHEVVLLNGVTVIVKVAHVRHCHSRMMFVRVYPRETQEMVFDAHADKFTQSAQA
jgi:transposase